MLKRVVEEAGWESVSVLIPPGFVVRADEAGLAQAVANVLRNAVQASRGGPVFVSATEDRDWVRLEIADDGPGFPEELLPRIFDPFTHRPHAAAGLGIGLMVVRRLIERMGGMVRVRNREEGGAEVLIELPSGRL